MNSQYRHILRQKIVDAVAMALPSLTRRDTWLPTVPNKATAVIGMRRVGKTSLLWQIIAERHAEGVPREGLLYINFEDERLAGLQGNELSILLEEYYRLYPEWRDQRRAAFFLDEIQVIPGWEQFSRRLLDSETVDLFVSGSSARMLSRDIASSMRGRAMETIVFPFSFRESLRHAGQEPQKPPEHLTKAERSLLHKQLLSYLEQGGFPEAQGLDPRNRAALLTNYVDVVILRDVIERHGINQPLVLRWMVRQLLGNAAGLFSINKFHADLKSQGVPVGKDTLHSYLGYLEDTFLLQSITVATDSERRRRVNPRKAYPIDTGLIPVFDRSGKANLGHALETALFLELLRKGSDVSYVRTEGGFEVDFHVRAPSGDEALIQVCANPDDTETLNREIRALLDAEKDYHGADLLLITLDQPTVEIPGNITVRTAGDWLLEQ